MHRASGKRPSLGLVPWLGLALATLAALYAAAPSATGGTGFPTREALRTVSAIASEPHPTGSAANARVRSLIEERLRTAGLETTVVPSEQHPFVRSVVGRRPGTDATGTILLSAHYDSAPQAPGAGDNAAAVAALLATVETLRGESLRNDLFVVFPDSEESGLLGARSLVRQLDLADVAVVLNFDARGSAGRTLMFETSRGNAALAAAWAEAAPRPSGSSMMAEVYRRMPNDTDFSVYRDAGLPGLNFAFIARPTSYHTPHDRPENLEPPSLEHHGRTMLALARHLGGLDLGRLAHDEDAVYFDVLGRAVVHWPARLASFVTLGAGALLLFVLLRGRATGRLRLRATLFGAGVHITVVLAAALAGAALSWWLPSLLEGRLHGPVPASFGDGWFFAACSVLVAALAILADALAASWAGARERLAGGLLLWLGLLAAATALWPGASYAFLVPLLALLPALALHSARRRIEPLAATLAVLGVLAIVVLHAPTVDLFFVGMGLEKLAVPAAALAAFLSPLAPVLAAAGMPGRRGALAALLLALALAIAGLGVA